MPQLFLSQRSLQLPFRVAPPHLAWLALPLILAITDAFGQAAASPEQWQQERERLLRQQLQQQPDVTVEPSTPDSPTPGKREVDGPFQDSFPEHEQPCRHITAITLEGDDAALFRFALRGVNQADDANSAIGRCLGSRGINTVLKRVQHAIIAHGYTTTRVLVPPQDLADGKLVLNVIAGRVGQVRLAPTADTRGTLVNALPLARGDILDLRDIEQGLENLKRVPSASADIQITPSPAADALPAYSDVVVNYRQALPLRLSVSLDDGGTRATGKYQAGMTLAYDNWWTLNDLFYVNLSRHPGRSRNSGSSGYALHYSVPAGYWLLAANLSGGRYHQRVAGAYQDFRYSGRSETTELKLSRLVQRNRSSKTTLFAKGLLRTAYNAIDDTEIGAQQRRTVSWEAGLMHRHFVNAATLDLSLAYRHSLDRQGAPPSAPFDAPQLLSRYGLWLADASLNAPGRLGPLAMRYAATARAQWTRGEIAPHDRFAIGGRYSVRGFDGELTLQAERGWLVRNEVAVALWESAESAESAESGTPRNNAQECYVGIDTGQVAGPQTRWLTGRRLSGAALGWRGHWRALSYDAFVATPLARPDHFATAPLSAGFTLSWVF